MLKYEFSERGIIAPLDEHSIKRFIFVQKNVFLLFFDFFYADPFTRIIILCIIRATPNKVCCGGCSSVGRAPDCDSGCRGFKPRQSPHLFPLSKILISIYILFINLS